MNEKISHDSNRSASLYELSDLLVRGKFSKSYVYDLMKRNCFPKPTLVLGSRFTRWSAAECEKWFANPTQWIDSQKENGLKGE